MHRVTWIALSFLLAFYIRPAAAENAGFWADVAARLSQEQRCQTSEPPRLVETYPGYEEYWSACGRKRFLRVRCSLLHCEHDFVGEEAPAGTAAAEPPAAVAAPVPQQPPRPEPAQPAPEPLPAMEPEQLIGTFLRWARKNEWASAVRTIHPDDLRQFKKAMLPALAPKERASAIPNLFGPGATLDSVTDMDDALFFVKMMEGTRLKNAWLTIGSFDTELVGFVAEGQDTRHALLRHDMDRGRIAMEVVSLTWESDAWKIRLGDKMPYRLEGRPPALPAEAKN
jgi:hypothetical protein